MSMKMQRWLHKRWKQRGTDGIHWERRAKDEAHFFFTGHPVASAMQIAEISLECVPGLKGGREKGGLGWRRVNKRWVYAISAFVHFVLFFFPPTTEIYIFLSASNVKLISWVL